MNEKFMSTLLYVSIVSGIGGIVVFKQATVVAETAVVTMAFLLPMAILYFQTRHEQVKKACLIMTITEVALAFAIFAGNVRW